MHCPNCGQQQISSDTKFCSRCGMPLGLVSEVLANGGYLPQLAELNKPAKSLFTRRNGVGFSILWAMFFLIFAIFFGGILDVDILGQIGALLAFFGGAMWLIGSLIFLKPQKRTPLHPALLQHTLPIHGAAPGYALPPQQQNVPMGNPSVPRTGNWRDTSDLVPSVTESTTRLLEKDEL